MGDVWVDVLTFDQSIREIEKLVDRKEGGSVFTPNVDHVVKASSNEAFKRAYDRVSLSLADGMPLVWMSKLLGCPLPERVAGSDLLVPTLELAARRGWKVYLVGGAPGVAEAAARKMTDEMGINVVGWDDSRIENDGSDPNGASISRVKAARPDVVFVALGPPKQELWVDRAGDAIRPAIALGVGASLDFLIGKHKRAPALLRRVGLEWAYRLAQEPRRLWRRYLLEAPRFIGILWRTWNTPRDARIIDNCARRQP